MDRPFLMIRETGLTLAIPVGMLPTVLFPSLQIPCQAETP